MSSCSSLTTARSNENETVTTVIQLELPRPCKDKIRERAAGKGYVHLNGCFNPCDCYDQKEGKKDWDKEADYQESYLLSKLKNIGEVSQKGERTSINGPLEESLFQTTFELKRTGKFDHTMLDNFEMYLKSIKNVPTIHRSTLVMNNRELFDDNIVCTIDKIRASGVFFGNIYRNRLYIHCSVPYMYEPEHMKVMNTSEYHRYPDIGNLWVNFEFDKPSTVTIKYRAVEKSEGQKDPTFFGVSHYEMTIFKSTILQVICDPSFDSTKGERTRLYFVLNAPVRIRKGHNYRRSEREKRTPRYQRELTIQNYMWRYPQESRLHIDDVEINETHQKALTESSVFCIEFDKKLDNEDLYTILSRLHHRAGARIEFTKIEDWSRGFQWYTNGHSPYVCYPDLQDETFRNFINNTFIEEARYNVRDPSKVDDKKFKKGRSGAMRNKAKDKAKERQFSYCYLIEALLSRGVAVKNQLLVEEKCWQQFLDMITKYYGADEDHNLCESALEDLINHIDNHKRVGDIINLFEKCCKERVSIGQSNQITKEQYDEGYRRVRKVVLTPTRAILIVPETMMGNRVLMQRDYDGTRIIRVVFRDDDNRPMRLPALNGLLATTAISYLQNGITIASRDFGFLGSSNSQMRDNGAYFMEKWGAGELRKYQQEHYGNLPPPDHMPKIIQFRDQLGRFELAGSVAKAMARLGQCFTQAKLCTGIDIPRGQYSVTFDVQGGKAPDGDPYNFTDGIGSVSMNLAKKLAESMSLPDGCVPSAFQIRFRGIKGMIAINPFLDECASHFMKIAIDGNLKDLKPGNIGPNSCPFNYELLFRPSQEKFTMKKSKNDMYQIEMVKYSSPTPVTLNRPLINVLDHVSEMQSLESHRRVCGRIEVLMDQQMASFARFLIDEDACRNKLEEMPRRIWFAALKKMAGFALTTEPFFRSLIRAAINVTLARLLRKTQIQVPPTLGRSSFGVTDETGLLQSGQVFFQYTQNINLKNPGSNAAKNILLGKVMITKCPSVVAGDVRIFECVDIPELHHHNDVVVFPQHGPRSHPDEMAGSDLDGDEYSVIWDEDLMIDRNEKAFIFCCDKPKEKLTVEEMHEKMPETYVKYMEQDSVGGVSLNHLYQSDQHGINSEVCDKLATKISQALDFAKSGRPPLPMTTKWEWDKDTKKAIMPEKSERIPDYALTADKATIQPMYTSSRLIGTLYREMKAIDDVAKVSDMDEAEVIIDKMIDYEGWTKYQAEAAIELTKYNAQLRALMDHYGIRTEGEIFSGCILDIRNRISDKEQDDMSAYSTDTIIEEKMTQLYRRTREEFFREFGGFEAVTESTNARNFYTSDDVLRRVCRMPSDDMKRKAVAFYKVCYETALKTGDRKLSFGWLAYEILNDVRIAKVTSCTDPMDDYLVNNPLFKLINNHRKVYCADKQAELEKYLRNFEEPTNKTEENAYKVIKMFIDKYTGLDKVLFVFNAWAKTAGLISSLSEFEETEQTKTRFLQTNAANRFKSYHLALLIIMFATKQIGYVERIGSQNGQSILVQLDNLDDIHSLENNTTSDQWPLTDDAANRLTVAFFQFLASRNFRRMKEISFRNLGVNSMFQRGEWLPIHKSGGKTYYNLLLNLRFEELPISTDTGINTRTVHREAPAPFTISIPKWGEWDTVHKNLMKKTNCVQILGRKQADRSDSTIYLVSARGTVESLQKLREISSVRVPVTGQQLNENLTDEMSILCYYQITGIVPPKEIPLKY